jgi:hypothetical protein
MPNVLKFELKLLMMITTVYAYDNSYKTSITKQKSFQSLESDRIHKPSLYNKEFDRRTADVISGSLPLEPTRGKRGSTIQLSAIKGCHHILIFTLAVLCMH